MKITIQQMSSPHSRYPELDLLRSAAVIGMIIYHIAYDLNGFWMFDIDVLHGWWFVLERVIANLFLLLVGISFAISYDRTPREKRWPKYIQRGCLVLAFGCLVSIATFAIDRETYVRFGVLHLIGVSILILPIFARLKLWNLVIAAIVIGAGVFLNDQTTTTHLLIPIGLPPLHFATVDYFPLLPWFGSILMGLVIGQMFYVKHLRWREYFPSLDTHSSQLNALTWPSRHALIIYLAHQPIVLALLWIILGKPL